MVTGTPIAVHAASSAAVGVTERFDESLLVFRHTLGWERDDVYYLPRLVNPHRPAATELSAAVRSVIAERNRFDLALYEWAAARFDEQAQGLGDELTELDSLREAQIRDYGTY